MWNCLKYNFFQINLLPCNESHHLKQVCCLALKVIIFHLKVVACYVSVGFLGVSFLNVHYGSFGHVLFCTFQEYKHLINLSGSPPGHMWTRHSTFLWLHALCMQHTAEALMLKHSLYCNHTVTVLVTLTQAFTWLQSYHCTQIFCIEGSNNLWDPEGTKAYVTAADLIDSDGI